MPNKLTEADIKEVERVRLCVAKLLHKQSMGAIETWADLKDYPEWREEFLRNATEILNIIGSIPAKNQSLPDNEAWHKTEREFEAFCAGRNILIDNKFMRFLKVSDSEKEGK